MAKPTTPATRLSKALKTYFSDDISLTAPKTDRFFITSKGDEGFEIAYPSLRYTRIDGDIDLSICPELADFVKSNGRISLDSANVDGIRQATLSRVLKTEYVPGDGISFIYLKKVKADDPTRETDDLAPIESEPGIVQAAAAKTVDVSVSGKFPVATDPTEAPIFKLTAPDIVEKSIVIPPSAFDDADTLFRVYFDEETKSLTMDSRRRYVFSSSFNNLIVAPLKCKEAVYTFHFYHSESEAADWVMLESKGLHLTLRQWFRVIVR